MLSVYYSHGVLKRNTGHVCSSSQLQVNLSLSTSEMALDCLEASESYWMETKQQGFPRLGAC